MRLSRRRRRGLQPPREQVKTFGMALPILVAIRFALTRKIRAAFEQARGHAVSWWSRAREVVVNALSMPTRIAKAIARGMSEHRAVTAMILVAYIGLQVATLA